MLDANEILTACALRFDGHAYASATGFDRNAAMQRYFDTGAWPEAAEERLALFFLLQRALHKWELLSEPTHGPFRRAFRELFFEVCATDVPEAYRVAEYAGRWEEVYAPRLAECVDVVRRVHESARR